MGREEKVRDEERKSRRERGRWRERESAFTWNQLLNFYLKQLGKKRANHTNQTQRRIKITAEIRNKENKSFLKLIISGKSKLTNFELN